MGLRAKIDQTKLTIEIDLEEPRPSSSGKTMVIASSHGNVPTNVLVGDKPLFVGLNAYIKR